MIPFRSLHLAFGLLLAVSSSALAQLPSQLTQSQPQAQPGSGYVPQDQRFATPRQYNPTMPGALPNPAGATPLPAPQSTYAPGAGATRPPPVIDNAAARPAGTPLVPTDQILTEIPIGPLDLDQKAWDAPTPARGQTSPGRRVFDDANQIMVVWLREITMTTFILPPGERVATAVVGAPNGFQVVYEDEKGRALPPNMIGLRAKYYDISTSFDVYTDSEHVYSFQVRTCSAKCAFIADRIVQVTGISTLNPGKPVEPPRYASPPAAGTPPATATSPTLSKVDPQPIDPNFGPVFEDLKILSGQPEDVTIAPIKVFRNFRFTYLEYGPKFRAADVPVPAKILPDGTEQQVQFVIEGTRMRITGTGNFVLRADQRVICIKELQPLQYANQ